ncbi:hypothetical protein BKP37_07295 [Anaerobacillus alkalilacustris]|uniref:Cell wall elongation regulator TseB-like domain-containing protein n=1 Tax=Anaerobacillus alkalilacustris TaxID=393763 RepID=A0A1S2LQJ4_9BACI|nr:DUF5590 domain-containing protein [Anaerobacillus alkalilacustris]OIJ14778.1 hypothetical protein BKP37_07295 [Anaerobacillus alkalilacustris]
MMRKAIIFFLLIFSIIIIWQGIHLYSVINKSFQLSEKEALQYIESKNLDLVDIYETSFYNGTESYQVIVGKNSRGKEIIIWVADTLDTHFIRKKEDGISYEQVLSFIESELSPEETISIKLGIEQSVPLYEIIYKDQSNRFSYYYISFKDGKYLKHYHLGRE